MCNINGTVDCVPPTAIKSAPSLPPLQPFPFHLGFYLFRTCARLYSIVPRKPRNRLIREHTSPVRSSAIYRRTTDPLERSLSVYGITGLLSPTALFFCPSSLWTYSVQLLLFDPFKGSMIGYVGLAVHLLRFKPKPMVFSLFQSPNV